MTPPPEAIHLDWCDRCGRTNRNKSLRAKHYERGVLCSGRIFTLVYKPTGEEVG